MMTNLKQKMIGPIHFYSVEGFSVEESFEEDSFEGDSLGEEESSGDVFLDEKITNDDM